MKFLITEVVYCVGNSKRLYCLVYYFYTGHQTITLTQGLELPLVLIYLVRTSFAFLYTCMFRCLQLLPVMILPMKQEKLLSLHLNQIHCQNQILQSRSMREFLMKLFLDHQYLAVRRLASVCQFIHLKRR